MWSLASFRKKLFVKRRRLTDSVLLSGSKTPCNHSIGLGSRDQSEEPRPVRSSTPRKASTPATSCLEEVEQRPLRASTPRKASTPAVSCLEELEQQPAPVNRNFKEGMMNLNRTDSRARTVSVDASLPSFRQPTQASIAAKVTPARPMPKGAAPPQEEVIQTRHNRSKTLEPTSSQPTSRIGSLYLHNTVDELRKQLHDFQSSLNSGHSSSSMEGAEVSLSVQPAAPSSEALSAREMYERMQRDFEMMSMGVDVSSAPVRKQDDDAVSVTSSCSSTSSTSTASRRMSRIPVPSKPSRALSNPTTPEMARRKPRAGSLQPESHLAAARPPRTERKAVDRRKSMDTGRKRPVDLSRRSSMSAAKSSVMNGLNRWWGPVRQVTELGCGNAARRKTAPTVSSYRELSLRCYFLERATSSRTLRDDYQKSQTLLTFCVVFCSQDEKKLFDLVPYL